MRRAALSVLAALLAVAAAAGPAGAVGAFGPPATVVNLNCGSYLDSGAALGGDGIVRGWAVASGAGCTDQVWFFQGAGRSWGRVRSPYQSSLLAAGFDGTGAYLLYQAADGVRITKRTIAGTFTAGRLLSSAVAGQGAVFATAGTWWAVWTEPILNPDGSVARFALFQAKTYGTDRSRQRISFSGDDDAYPGLARRPGGGAVLAWMRTTATGSDVRVASSADGSWRSRAFTTAGTYNRFPDMATDATHTYLAWTRDRRIVAADNASGVFRSHTFNTGGDNAPRVAVSLGTVFVAWTPISNELAHVFVAERAGGSWSGLYLSSSTPSREITVGLAAYRGKATVRFNSEVSGSPEVLYARTQL